MDTFDLKKQQEIEITKARLDSTKKKLAETLTTISKTEAEHQEMQLQWSRKIKDLRSTEAAQYLRITKLNADLENMRTILQSRTDEHAQLLRTNAELREEFRAVQEQTVSKDLEFRKKLDVLDDKVKEGYLQLQNAKDAKVLIEVSLGSLTEEERIPYVEDMLKRRKTRQDEVNAEMDELEREQKLLDRDVKLKAEELAVLKDKYASLHRVYTMTKKVKEEQ